MRSGLTFKYICSSTETLREVTKVSHKPKEFGDDDESMMKILCDHIFVWTKVVLLIKKQPIIFHSCLIGHFQLEKEVNVVDGCTSPTKTGNVCHALRLNHGMMTNRSVSGYQPHSDVY